MACPSSSPVRNMQKDRKTGSAAVLPYAASDTLVRAHIDTRVAGRGLLLGRVDDALLDIRSQGEKGLFDIDVALCADLHKRDPKLICQGLALLCRDGAFLLPITLVANEDFVDALGRVLLDVGEPCSDVCLEEC